MLMTMMMSRLWKEYSFRLRLGSGEGIVPRSRKKSNFPSEMVCFCELSVVLAAVLNFKLSTAGGAKMNDLKMICNENRGTGI